MERKGDARLPLDEAMLIHAVVLCLDGVRAVVGGGSIFLSSEYFCHIVRKLRKLLIPT